MGREKKKETSSSHTPLLGNALVDETLEKMCFHIIRKEQTLDLRCKRRVIAEVSVIFVDLRARLMVAYFLANSPPSPGGGLLNQGNSSKKRKPHLVYCSQYSKADWLFCHYYCDD